MMEPSSRISIFALSRPDLSGRTRRECDEGRARLAFHQPDAEHTLFRRVTIAQQYLNGSGANVTHRLADGGQAWRDDTRHINVVKPDYGQPGWCRPSHIAQGVYRAKRHDIVCREQGGDPRMLTKHSPGQFDSPSEGMLSAQDHGLYRNGLARFQEPLGSQQKIAVPARPRDVPQFPVAQRKQVLPGKKPALEVV